MGKAQKKATVIAPPPKPRSVVARAFNAVRYELPLFVFLLILFVPQKSDASDDVYTALHAFDYSVGFAPRLFVGSLMSLFAEYKSLAFINGFMDVVSAITLVLFTVLAGRLIRKADEQAKTGTTMAVCVFLVGPYTIAAQYPRMTSVDRVVIVFTVLALVLIAVDRTWPKWFVPALLALALATYHGFAFMYMPAVAIVLLYSAWTKGSTKQAKALCLVGFVTMAAFSAYFFLYPGLSGYTVPEALVAEHATNTDIFTRGDLANNKSGIWLATIRELLLKDPVSLWQTGTKPFVDIPAAFRAEIFALIPMLPLLALLGYFWIIAMKKSVTRAEKFTYLLCLLAPLARTPMMIMSSNYMRGRIAVYSVQFLLLFYFMYVGAPGAKAALVTLEEAAKKRMFLFLLFIGYLAVPFLSIKTGPWWQAIMEFFK